VGSEVEIAAAVWLDSGRGEEGRVDGGPEGTLYEPVPVPCPRTLSLWSGRSGHWSTSRPGRHLRTPIRIPERGELQGTNRAITTCRLPLNHGTSSHSKVSIYPSTIPMYKETICIPPKPRPYGSTSIGYGQTRRNDKPPPRLSSNSNHISCMTN
jgi:hypothetical protein